VQVVGQRFTDLTKLLQGEQEMKTIQVKVAYTLKGMDIKTLPELDDTIRSALTNAGFAWYAQGFTNTTGERDICFDYNLQGERKMKKLTTGVVDYLKMATKIDELVGWVQKHDNPMADKGVLGDVWGFGIKHTPSPAPTLPIPPTRHFTDFQANNAFKHTQLLFQSYAEGKFVFQGYSDGGDYCIYGIKMEISGGTKLRVDASQLVPFANVLSWAGVAVIKNHVFVYQSGVALPDRMIPEGTTWPDHIA